MNKLSACTSILIGKNATIDHSIIIGRNEDSKASWPKHFIVHPHGDLPAEFISKDTGVKIPLPQPSYRYSATPEWTDQAGLFEEDGINEFDVAMSATESAYSNDLVLSADPYVENGINEEAMVTLVLPFVKSAREGVRRLGDLIAQYGTGETNGILFADNAEAWYMEIGSGHYWVAQRIPDDAYAVAGNQLAIQEIDFNDSTNFMYHPEIVQFVNQHQLNPHPDSFNFRQIFGTATPADAIYSTPRVWYGHHLFSPQAATVEHPEDQNLPFIMRPEKRLSILDAQEYLNSHFQGTIYDPLNSADQVASRRYRPISLAKTQESHLLQMKRPSANLHWLSMGVGAQSNFIPFYNGLTQTLPAYQKGSLPASLDSAYWVYKHVGVLVDHNLKIGWPLLNEVQQTVTTQALTFIHGMDQLLNTTPMEEHSSLINERNNQFAAWALEQYQKLAMRLLTDLTDDSPLNFNTDANL